MLVELALALPVLMLILVGLIQFGRAFHYWIDLTHLSSEGARWAVVRKNPGPEPNLQQHIACQASTGALQDDAKVYITFPEGESAGDPVRVRVEYEFTFVEFLTDLLQLPSADITLTGTTTQRLERANNGFVSLANNGQGCP